MKRKHSALILVFFIGMTALVWSNPGDTDAKRVPFTREIAHNTQNLGMLWFYVSKPFSIHPVPNNASRYDVRPEDGVRVPSGQNIPSDRIEVKTTDVGKLRTIGTAYETFDIVFNEIPLGFRRNSQGRYECFSAEINNRTYTLQARSEGGPVQLYINSIQPAEVDSRVEFQVIPNSAPSGQRRTNAPQPTNRDRQPYQALDVSHSSNQFSGRPSRTIDGHTYVNGRGITAYITHKNPSVNRETLNRLINTYISEAGIEGINLDIAIAQMLYATTFLSNQQRMTSHNYAGLSSTPGWDGRFYDMTTGVRAHIQHLKGYASTRLNRHLVDPRYQILADLGYLGRVRTFEQLFRAWTVSFATYEVSINEILNGLYRFSN